MANSDSSERVLVLAPVARDGPALATLLRERGFAAGLCQDLNEVRAQMAFGAGAVLLSEEALELAQTPDFFDQLKAQPPWSEIPLIILTRGGESRLARLLDLAADAAGAITLLERPIGTITLLRSIEVALGSRRRQYQVRSLIEEKERNISELKRAEEALREQKRFTESLVETAPSLTYIYDIREGRNVFVSSRSEDVLGYTREEIQGMGPRLMEVLLHPDDANSVAERFKTIWNSTKDEVSTLEYRMRRKGGSWVWLLSHDRVFRRDAQGKPTQILGVATDITERKNVEAALQAQEELLRRSERLSIAVQLASALAHEINNPLAAVVNSLYLSRTLAKDQAPLRDYLEMADRELSRISHIVKQHLSFYRSGDDLEEIDVSSEIEGAVTLLAGQISDRGLTVLKDLNAVSTVRGSLLEIRQMLVNLLVNAAEASPQNATIRISAREATDWVQPNRTGVRITIVNQGYIPRDMLPHIFEPFVTTKGEKGTGLGLWVCDGIVRKHEGKIMVRSSAQKNRTAFSVFLPATASAGRRRAAA